MVEIDGSSHEGKEKYDHLRQEYLESLGLKVFRITDFDIKHNLVIVMKDLENFIIENFTHFDNHPDF